MGHDDHHGHAAPAAAGEPTPMLSDPSAVSTARCRRRWQDLVLLRVDASAPASYAGKDARFPNPADLSKLVRERYLLFVQCLEAKPGAEPRHPYLYPQPTVAAAAAAHHH